MFAFALSCALMGQSPPIFCVTPLEACALHPRMAILMRPHIVMSEARKALLKQSNAKKKARNQIRSARERALFQQQKPAVTPTVGEAARIARARAATDRVEDEIYVMQEQIKLLKTELDKETANLKSKDRNVANDARARIPRLKGELYELELDLKRMNIK